MYDFDVMMERIKSEKKVPEYISALCETTLQELPEHAKASYGGASRDEYADSSREKYMGNIISIRNRRARMPYVAAAAVALVLCTVTVSAAWVRWSRGLENRLQVTDSQKESAVESGLASNLGTTDEASGIDDPSAITVCENNGVKITAEQSIADDYFAMISFKIEGFELPEGTEPSIGNVDVRIDGDYPMVMSASFYDGLVAGSDGRVIYDDGTIPDYDSPLEVRYFADDGSLEYDVWFGNDIEGGLLGKEVEVHFGDLGIAPGKADHETTVEGSWDFKWTLTGSDEIREVELDVPIGDTEYRLVKAIISPISFTSIVESDEPWVPTNHGDDFPIMMTGVRMTDGTLYPHIFDGGGSGFTDETYLAYRQCYSTDRILEPDAVDALLFIMDYPEGDEPLTEENLYIVEIQ